MGRRIRAERLRRCRQELLEPAAARDGVAAVARRWGFVSPSHFSRALREEYGQSPRDWQKWASERNASAAA
ncbi:helix-turn-helix domain-containing protein [Streptomyces cyaneofuscatus]|uniref:helix-turn-helix domain-containing protein n=1 Tax=Streptomyces cyaneofuscatus TaxID=66883 RepID=UPI00380B4F45